MRALVLGIAISLMASSSLAQQDEQFSAKYLLPYCRDAINNKAPTISSDAVMQGMCVGMVDAIDFIMSELPPEEKEYRSCPPSDATLRQTVQVVIKYIDERPERMNESFKKLAIEAIRDAWPCGTN
jgi:Rap1a immunity proteins